MICDSFIVIFCAVAHCFIIIINQKSVDRNDLLYDCSLFSIDLVVICRGTENSSSHGDCIELMTASTAPVELNSKVQVSSEPTISFKKFKISIVS